MNGSDRRSLSKNDWYNIPTSGTSKFEKDFGRLPFIKITQQDTIFKVSTVPAKYGFNSFYKKFLNVKGLPIISSEKVSDDALYKARSLVLMMVRKVPQILDTMVKYNARIAIVGKTEQMTDLPEYANMDAWINSRARGMGGWIEFPVTSCGEENLLCLNGDRYHREDIFVHEFGHTIHKLGLAFLNKQFERELKLVYEAARNSGLWKNTYAISNPEEYFAKGIQCWFDVNRRVSIADGIDNEVATNADLLAYDPKLYALISKYFHLEANNPSCHYHKEKWIPWGQSN